MIIAKQLKRAIKAGDEKDFNRIKKEVVEKKGILYYLKLYKITNAHIFKELKGRIRKPGKRYAAKEVIKRLRAQKIGGKNDKKTTKKSTRER